MPPLETACPLDCPDACSLEVTVEDGRATRVTGSPRNPTTAGYICAKVRRLPEHVHGPDRVLQPWLRTGPRGAGIGRAASWDEALTRVAERLRTTVEHWGGEAILPISYGGSNGFVTQGTADARLFDRLGACRLDRTLCAAPSSAASAGLYGNMPGVDYSDYEHASLIVLWGANPTASGIHLVPHIQRAQARGAKLVVLDPRRHRLARRADLHLPVRPGTDLPVALALLRFLFEDGGADASFMAAHVDGADQLRTRAHPWTLPRAAEAADVSLEALTKFAHLYRDASPAVIRCGWGLERNRHGGSAVAAVLALPAVAGKFGIRGGGYTMSNTGAWDLDGRAAANSTPPPTRQINLNQVGRALVTADGPAIRFAFVYNANPLVTLPRQDLVRRGLERDDLFTVVFDSIWTDTARLADVVLPATTFLEHHELSRGYGALALFRSRPVLDPVGESRDNVAVFSDLCARLGLEEPNDATSGETVAEQILSSSPEGPRLVRQLQQEGIAHPACGTAPIQFVDTWPGTPNQRVDLVPQALDQEAPSGLYGYEAESLDAPFPLALISPATDKSISSTLAQLDSAEASLQLHPEDASTRGITDGTRVRIFNDFGELRIPARLNPNLRRGVVFLPKGLWLKHTDGRATANLFCPDSLTDLGGGACFNDARVQVESAGNRGTHN